MPHHSHHSHVKCEKREIIVEPVAPWSDTICEPDAQWSPVVPIQRPLQVVQDPIYTSTEGSVPEWGTQCDHPPSTHMPC